MNLFGAVVFWTLIITFFVKLISELLNLKAADAKLPFEFVGLFDEEAYRKSRDYLNISTRFRYRLCLPVHHGLPLCSHSS